MNLAAQPLRQWAAVWCLAWVTTAAIAVSDKSQAQSLKNERARIEAEFKRGEQECATRFEVTRCVDDLQRQRRAALAVVRQQEVELEDARRNAATQANQQRLKDKQAKAAAKAASSPADAVSPLPEPPAAKPPKAVRAHSGKAAAGPASSASGSAAAAIAAAPVPAAAPSTRSRQRATADQDRADAASAAAKRAAAHEQRLIDAAERRQRVEQANAKRAEKGRPSVPLPDPAAASSPVH